MKSWRVELTTFGEVDEGDYFIALACCCNGVYRVLKKEGENEVTRADGVVHPSLDKDDLVIQVFFS